MRTLNAPGALDQIKEYYGRTLQTKRDLKTGACCATDSLPEHVRSVLALIDKEITEKFYGCGSPIPADVAGLTVLDLGCGTGRDVYIVSKLVGADGRVIGVDMTPEQLAIAGRHIDAQMSRFGFPRPNVEFHHGYIEDLESIGLRDGSVDVVISNCVINLSPDKCRVFSEIFRALKPGGELYFSDVFAGRRVPPALADDPVLRGECLGGAMYIEDFRRLLRELGCLDYRVIAKRRITLNDGEIEAKAGMIPFYSMTIRSFKLAGLEDRCEDYGQVATYRGTLAESPHAFVLDDHHNFETGKPVPVCGNTAAMLQETRYARHFTVVGDRSTHYGPFGCSNPTSDSDTQTQSGSPCC
jgi:SAM-dependent methyltransferase